jgi:hypothetical protein
MTPDGQLALEQFTACVLCDAPMLLPARGGDESGDLDDDEPVCPDCAPYLIPYRRIVDVPTGDYL